MAISIASSSNPTLSEERFCKYRATISPGQAMTLRGGEQDGNSPPSSHFSTRATSGKPSSAPTESTGMVTLSDDSGSYCRICCRHGHGLQKFLVSYNRAIIRIAARTPSGRNFSVD